MYVISYIYIYAISIYCICVRVWCVRVWLFFCIRCMWIQPIRYILESGSSAVLYIANAMIIFRCTIFNQFFFLFIPIISICSNELCIYKYYYISIFQLVIAFVLWASMGIRVCYSMANRIWLIMCNYHRTGPVPFRMCVYDVRMCCCTLHFPFRNGLHSEAHDLSSELAKCNIFQ